MDPLYMFNYGIGVIPLIQQLKAKFLYTTNPWYDDDDVGALCTYENTELYLNFLKQFGPGHGYFTPNPQKVF